VLLRLTKNEVSQCPTLENLHSTNISGYSALSCPRIPSIVRSLPSLNVKNTCRSIKREAIYVDPPPLSSPPAPNGPTATVSALEPNAGAGRSPIERNTSKPLKAVQLTRPERSDRLGDNMKPQMLRCWIAGILLCALLAARGQTNPYGLIAIKAGATADTIDKKETNSRLYILGPTNQHQSPILRLIIADKPLMVGRLSLFEGTIINDPQDQRMQAFKIPLATNQCSLTAYAQIIDVPITNGPARDLLVAMFNSAPNATVAVDVVNADNVSQSKSYIVPALAIQELRRQYSHIKPVK
jgi:hypothetical protein